MGGGTNMHFVLEEEGGISNKLDGVGPVDNRPSTDKLHPFVKKIKIKNNTGDT